MKKIIVANWKMNLSFQKTKQLAERYRKIKIPKSVEIAVAPSFPFLFEVNRIVKHEGFKLASQNIAAQAEGAYTGEVSGSMLHEIGCQYVIVGHSERRLYVSESDEMINKKVNQCYHNNLIPILCVGESLQENKDGQRDSVLVKQIQRALDKVDGLPENQLVVAYEPVWAIGSGQYVEPEQMQEVQRVIKRAVVSLYSEKFYDEKVRLLYGGSVNSVNAKAFINQPGVDGLLVATASLEAEMFEDIINQAS